MNKNLVSLLLFLAGTFVFAADDWPFITIRHTMGVNNNEKIFRELLSFHDAKEQTCNEFWFATGSRKTPDELAKECATFARYRSACEDHNIALGYQQGLTLGHGAAHDGPAKPGEQKFSDDAWQCDRNGKRIGFLCPRSPEVLAYQKEYTKTVLRVANPVSDWLDDDLRLGIAKPEGCFCPRCIDAFNKETGQNLKREEIVTRLFSAKTREPLRAQWISFNSRSLAKYAAATREAADEINSPVRLAYQAVWSDTIYTGRDNRAILEALSGANHRPVGIRPGAGFYKETEPRDMIKKCLSVAREAERCKDYGDLVGTVCYEQETYPRHVLHKSPGAIVTECALAHASGCDTLSLYWYAAEAPEPVEEYERFLEAIRNSRPYFERLAKSVRTTRLAGAARFIGEGAGELPDFDLRDPVDMFLACAGVPVTVEESGTKVWYLTKKSIDAMTDADWKKLEQGGAVVPKSQAHRVPEGAKVKIVDDFEQYPIYGKRLALLDAFDEVSGGNFPVRLDAIRPLRILPRVRQDGKTENITLLNCSIGATGRMELRVRNTLSNKAFWMQAGKAPVNLVTSKGARADELVVTIPDIAGWNIGTIFFE